MRRLVIPLTMLDLPAPNRDAILDELDISDAADVAMPADIKFVFVCFTNRSGSNYLCDLLASTNWFNRGQEWFNVDVVRDVCRAKEIHSLRRYVVEIVRENARNGHFIVKVAAEQLAMLCETDVLAGALDRSMIIWIQRADKLDQAISLDIAEQNNRWAWYLPADVDDNSLQFSAESIAKHIHWITVQNLAFDRFFAVNGLKPLPVFYESLLDHPDSIIRQIARAVGQPNLTIDRAALQLKRQAGEINRQWRESFQREVSTRLIHGIDLGFPG
jgi:LPS sulfotransferase NodH